MNVELSLLIKGFARIEKREFHIFYLIKKKYNVLFHIKKSNQLRIIMLQITEIFNTNRKIKVLGIKLEVFITMNNFQSFLIYLHKNSLHRKF